MKSCFELAENLQDQKEEYFGSAGTSYTDSISWCGKDYVFSISERENSSVKLFFYGQVEDDKATEVSIDEARELADKAVEKHGLHRVEDVPDTRIETADFEDLDRTYFREDGEVYRSVR